MVLSQAIGSIVSLGLEGEHMCYIIARVRNTSTVGFFIILIREFYLFVFIPHATEFRETLYL